MATRMVPMPGSRHCAIGMTCDGWLELIVSDDWRGGADASSGSGLTGLVDRVEAIGGTIQIDSRPGAGTLVHARLPTRGLGPAAYRK
jgi:signal transduction histidine kinase